MRPPTMLPPPPRRSVQPRLGHLQRDAQPPVTVARDAVHALARDARQRAVVHVHGEARATSPNVSVAAQEQGHGLARVGHLGAPPTPQSRPARHLAARRCLYGEAAASAGGGGERTRVLLELPAPADRRRAATAHASLGHPAATQPPPHHLASRLIVKWDSDHSRTCTSNYASGRPDEHAGRRVATRSAVITSRDLP